MFLFLLIYMSLHSLIFFFFFFNDTATTEIYTLSLTTLFRSRGKKTDYRDCRALLEHLRTGSLVTIWRPDAATREIRQLDRKSTRLNSSHANISYAVFCLKKKKNRMKCITYNKFKSSIEELLY